MVSLLLSESSPILRLRQNSPVRTVCYLECKPHPVTGSRGRKFAAPIVSSLGSGRVFPCGPHCREENEASPAPKEIEDSTAHTGNEDSTAHKENEGNATHKCSCLLFQFIPGWPRSCGSMLLLNIWKRHIHTPFAYSNIWRPSHPYTLGSSNEL